MALHEPTPSGHGVGLSHKVTPLGVVDGKESNLASLQDSRDTTSRPNTLKGVDEVVTSPRCYARSKHWSMMEPNTSVSITRNPANFPLGKW